MLSVTFDDLFFFYLLLLVSRCVVDIYYLCSPLVSLGLFDYLTLCEIESIPESEKIIGLRWWLCSIGPRGAFLIRII